LVTEPQEQPGLPTGTSHNHTKQMGVLRTSGVSVYRLVVGDCT
jgi:hypothetical protein